mgnify:CR=1 FL=1
MKILHVIASVAPRYGGPSKLVLELCREVGKQQQDVTIFTTNIDGKQNLDVPLNTPVEVEGIKVWYFPVQFPREYKFSMPMLNQLRTQVQNYDIVHIHSIYLFHTLIAAHYCRKFKVPYLIRPHGILDPFIRNRHSCRKKIYEFFFEKRNLNGAAAIHYTAKEEMELAEPLKIRASGAIVPNGIDLSEYANLPKYGSFRKKYPELEGRKIILFLSRINFKKGMDVLARAFGEVARKRNDVNLVLAGPDNEGYGIKVRNWLEEEIVLSRSLFTGMLLGEEKLSVLRDSDLFVLPSYSENFGIAVVEAMACGLPVIISNKVNIWREVVEAGAGLVTDCDSHQVAEAILEVLDDSPLAEDMGERGKKLVAEKYAWPKIVDKLIRTYNDIISGSGQANG